MKNDLLLYGKEYHLWRNDKYLGIATWTDDENIGEAFLKTAVDGEDKIVHQVHIADKWKFS